MATSASAVKAAVYAVCQSLYPAPTLVVYGWPGVYQPDQIVAVMGQTSVFGSGPMSTQRLRDETVQTTVVFSVFRPGDDTGQKAATEAAYALAGPFVSRFQTSPNETLGGACREARVTEMALAEQAVTSREDPSLVLGMSASVTAILTTIARV